MIKNIELAAVVTLGFTSLAFGQEAALPGEGSTDGVVLEFALGPEALLWFDGSASLNYEYRDSNTLGVQENGLTDRIISIDGLVGGLFGTYRNGLSVGAVGSYTFGLQEDVGDPNYFFDNDPTDPRATVAIYANHDNLGFAVANGSMNVSRMQEAGDETQWPVTERPLSELSDRLGAGLQTETEVGRPFLGSANPPFERAQMMEDYNSTSSGSLKPLAVGVSGRFGQHLVALNYQVGTVLMMDYTYTQKDWGLAVRYSDIRGTRYDGFQVDDQFLNLRGTYFLSDDWVVGARFMKSFATQGSARRTFGSSDYYDLTLSHAFTPRRFLETRVSLEDRLRTNAAGTAVTRTEEKWTYSATYRQFHSPNWTTEVTLSLDDTIRSDTGAVSSNKRLSAALAYQF